MTPESRPANPRPVALIPARAGSRRMPGKNIRSLAGHPLLAYTIAAARASEVFSAVVVSTEDAAIAEIARRYGAETPFLRPVDLAESLVADIAWVQHALRALQDEGFAFDCFSILRPTSPFRHAATIQRAWVQFADHPQCDSLRAVERCTQHPGKMWRVEEGCLQPLLDDGGSQPPWHSTPYQGLPEVYVQNASLEIAWNDVVREQGSIAGTGCCLSSPPVTKDSISTCPRTGSWPNIWWPPGPLCCRRWHDWLISWNPSPVIFLRPTYAIRSTRWRTRFGGRRYLPTCAGSIRCT